MGFFTEEIKNAFLSNFSSQSLSGWDGVFHLVKEFAEMLGAKRRNPFQGGMGFFTFNSLFSPCDICESQSLSGWDGVFHWNETRESSS